MTACWVWVGLATCIVASAILRPNLACAGQSPSLLLTLPGTSEPMGFLSRRDGSVPDEAAAGRDRIACLVDPKVVPTSEIRRLLRIAKGDKSQAYRVTTRILAACMEGKGWVTEVCGGPEGPVCDLSDRMDVDDHEAFE